MAQHGSTQSYNFESQLELGEMLLGLGRIEEAAVELKKAKDLNEIGAYSTADGDPQRQTDLRRLAQALSRVEDLQGESSRANRTWSYLAAALLLGLTGIVFFVWALNRNELNDIRVQATADAQLISAERSQEQAQLNQSIVEVTRISEQVQDLYSENSHLVYAGTQVASAFEEAMDVARESNAVASDSRAVLETIQAEAVAAVASSEAANVAAPTAPPAGSANETPVPLPTEIPPTPLSDQELGDTIDQLRVDAFRANLRQGPGFQYYVIDSLLRGSVVTVLAKSEDTYWYNIVTEEGVSAWLHTSVAKPLSLDWLPPAETVPAPPFIPPTPEPTATPIPPLPTAIPTVIPTEIPTAEPVEEAPTEEPPTEEVTPPEEEVIEEPTPEPTAESSDGG